MSPEFLLTSLVVVIAPGTGVLYTVAAGLSRGRLTSVVAAFGCTLGILPHLLACNLGLAALLHESAVAFQAVKIAGVAYLLYMAWQTLTETGTLSVDDSFDARSAGRVIGRAILVNLLNPKLSIFFLAFLPQFVDSTETAPVLKMTELGAVFMAMTFVVFVGYGLFAAAFRRQVMSRPSVLAWMRRVFAGAFVLLGAKLAVESR